jgi:hypothetical protein
MLGVTGQRTGYRRDVQTVVTEGFDRAGMGALREDIEERGV